MGWKKVLVWVVIGGALALFALAFFSTTFNLSQHTAMLGKPPPAGGPSSEPRPAAPPPPPRPAAPVDEVRITPPKTYAPRSAIPPRGEIEHRNPPAGGIDPLGRWPDERREGAFEQLARANMAFNVDNKFNVKETGQAKVVIDFSKAVDELKNELSKSGRAGSITGGASVQVSKVVIANIIAPGLTVTPITPTEQVVLQTEPTVWLWDLKADEPGTYQVRITLTASIIVDGRATNRFLQVHDETVVIEIKPTQRVIDLAKEHWQWAFSSLLAPLGIWLWKRRKGNQTE